MDFSCGNSHTIAIDYTGDAYALGSNEYYQLGMPGEKTCKSFKKISNQIVGDVKKGFCISDCTFLTNSDSEVYFCGRYSLKSKGYII